MRRGLAKRRKAAKHQSFLRRFPNNRCKTVIIQIRSLDDINRLLEGLYERVGR